MRLAYGTNYLTRRTFGMGRAAVAACLDRAAADSFATGAGSGTQTGYGLPGSMG